MCQGNEATPALTIKDFTLKVVPQFTYLGSTTSDNACLGVELGKRIGKAATNTAKLSARVWENKKLNTHTKIAIYRACIVSTLLCGSASWSTYAGQEKRLNIFHMRCLRLILPSRGRIRSETMRYLKEPISPQCSPSSDSAD